MGHEEVHDRVARLEQRVRFLQATCAIVAAALVGVACAGLRASTRQTPEASVLTARGLVIVDTQGRPRVLLGAPIPHVSARTRTDSVTGLLVLGEGGADRVQVGNVGGPQVGGVVSRRISASAGIVVNDPKGNERGGFGAFDDGRVVLGLDYPDGEAISLAVLPQEGATGIWLNGPTPQGRERVGAVVTREGQALLKLADLAGTERVILMVDGNTAAKLLLVDPKDKSMRDVLGRVGP